MSEIVVPKYEPRCERCGHNTGTHSTTGCAHHYAWPDGDPAHRITCDCPGWKRDEQWPPPVVVRPY